MHVTDPHGIPTLARSYLNYDKTVAVFSPSSDVLVGGILQHADTLQSVRALRLGLEIRMNTGKVCEPRSGYIVSEAPRTKQLRDS